MKRFVYPLVLLLVVVAAGLVGFVLNWLSPKASDCVTFTDVPVDAVEVVDKCVRITGIAHYEVKGQSAPDNGTFGDGKIRYLFPFLPEGKTDQGMIPVMIHTTRTPDRLTSFELMTIEGRVWEATSELVPWNLEVQMGKASNYYFSDTMVVVEPVRVISGDEVWVP